MKQKEKKCLIIGVIGADVHAVGNTILYHAFTEAGFDVVNLGVMVSQEEYIAAAIEANKPVEEPEHEAEIGIESFGAVELRVAEILSAEPIPKAKKLLKLQVDLGYEKRQVVSGIAKFYTPDQLVGKKVCLVTNLKPAKLCGVDSFGMILASGEEDVKVVFLDPTAKNGDRIH